jgi:hypothetical protein
MCAAVALAACTIPPMIEFRNNTGHPLLVHYKDDGEIAYWDDKVAKIAPGATRTWFLTSVMRGPLVHVTGGDCDYAYDLRSRNELDVPFNRVARLRIEPGFSAHFSLRPNNWDSPDAPPPAQFELRPSSKICGADRRSLKITTEEERAL